MKEIKGNIWSIDCDAVCITTNGFVKKNGEAVMGRGCALEAVKRYPFIPSALGGLLLREGNNVYCLVSLDDLPAVVSFPVKPIDVVVTMDNLVGHMRSQFMLDGIAPGWAAKADTEIIERSAEQLVKLADEKGWTKVVLPRPGCGAGELEWSDVRPFLGRILDDRFISVTF